MLDCVPNIQCDSFLHVVPNMKFHQLHKHIGVCLCNAVDSGADEVFTAKR